MQTRSAAGKTNTLTGTSDYTIDGAIYLPTTKLQLNGAANLNPKSGYVIAKEFEFGGSSNFTFDAFSIPLPESLAGPKGVLVQ